MATENQDLVLVVTLADNASQQMARIRQDVVATTRGLQQIKMPEIIKNLERIEKDAQKFGSQIRGMAEGIQEMLSAIPVLGKMLGGLTPQIERAIARIPVSGRVAIFGGAAAAAGAAAIAGLEKSMASFSRDAMTIKVFADTAGFMAAEFEEWQKQLSVTMSPQEAQQLLSGFGQAIQEWGETNKQRELLMRSVEPGIQGFSAEQMDAIVNKARSGDKAGSFNDAVDIINQTRENSLRRGMHRNEAMAQQNKMLAQAHLTPSALRAPHLRPVSKEEKERFDRRLELSKQQNLAWRNIELKVEEAALKIAVGMMPIMKKLEAWLKVHGGSLAKLAATEIVTDLQDVGRLGLAVVNALAFLARLAKRHGEGITAQETGGGSTPLFFFWWRRW